MPITLTSTQWLVVIDALIKLGARDVAIEIARQRGEIARQRGARRFVLVLPPCVA